MEKTAAEATQGCKLPALAGLRCGITVAAPRRAQPASCGVPGVSLPSPRDLHPDPHPNTTGVMAHAKRGDPLAA
jgi:hypothetical protein